MSAAEVAAIGLLAYNPEYKWATQYALLPGVWWKAASRMAFACIGGQDSCQPRRLVDGPALLQACDYTALIEPFNKAAGSSADVLALASGMLLACAVSMPVVPELWVSLVALGLFIMCIFQTACSPLPTLFFLALLTVTAVFGAQPEAGAAAAGGAGPQAAPSKAAQQQQHAGKAGKKATAKKRR